MEDRAEPGAELGELIDAMTPPQQLRFKRLLVRKAIDCVSRRLPPLDQDEGHRDGIRAAESWLSDPTAEKAEAATLFAAASCWDGGVRYHDYGAEFLGPAWVAGEADVGKAAVLAVQCAPASERDAARRQQIVAAQAICRGETAELGE